MGYLDIATLQTIAAGQPLSSATVQQVRDNGEFLIDPPAASIFNSAAQSVPDATMTALTANSENFDNDSMHSTSSTTSRITFQTAGRYLLVGTAIFAANATGERNVTFLKNGTTQIEGTKVTANASGSQTTVVTAVRTLVFAAGDYVEMRVRHRNSGGALDVTMDEFFAGFWTR